jgi:hypothetical protein
MTMTSLDAPGVIPGGAASLVASASAGIVPLPRAAASGAGSGLRRVAADGYAVIDAGGWLDLARLASLYRDVPADPYVPEGFRYKSLARLRMQGTEPIAGSHEPLYQSLEFNPVHGGIQRHYPPLSAGFIAALADPLRLFQAMTRLGEDDEVLVQAQRVTTGTGGIGHPAVEGFHQDGVEYVGILLVGREGLAGGKTLVAADADGRDLVFAGELQPGQLLVLDDRRVWHYTSPVRDVAGPGLGHRDVILFGWPSCRRPGRDDQAEPATAGSSQSRAAREG